MLSYQQIGKEGGNIFIYWRMSRHSVPLSLSWNSCPMLTLFLLRTFTWVSFENIFYFRLCMYIVYPFAGSVGHVLIFSLPALYINVTGQSLPITTYPQSSQIKPGTNGFDEPSGLDGSKIQRSPCILRDSWTCSFLEHWPFFRNILKCLQGSGKGCITQ